MKLSTKKTLTVFAIVAFAIYLIELHPKMIGLYVLTLIALHVFDFFSWLFEEKKEDTKKQEEIEEEEENGDDKNN